MIQYPIHISYELSRRQRLVAHVGMWLCYWQGLLMLGVVVAGVIVLAVLKSLWFLLILLIGVPPLNNLHRLLAGLVNPLVFGPLRMDVTIEENRMGYRLGQVERWIPSDEIVRVERFGDVWVILTSDGAGIDIPVSMIAEEPMEHLRAMSQRARASTAAEPSPGERWDP